MFFNDDWDPDRMMDGSYGGGGGMMGNGGFWMMAVFGLLLLMLVGTATFLALKAGRTPTPVSHVVGQVASPRDVLDLRLAKGEVSPEEYNTTRTLLGP